MFQVLGIKTEIKPTVKNLNSQLLKFKQGTEIHEKSMNIAGLDGHQVFEILSFHKTLSS
jgi:hypothetical protein